jgi:hypothetical protein
MPVMPAPTTSTSTSDVGSDRPIQLLLSAENCTDRLVYDMHFSLDASRWQTGSAVVVDGDDAAP